MLAAFIKDASTCIRFCFCLLSILIFYFISQSSDQSWLFSSRITQNFHYHIETKNHKIVKYFY